MTTKAAVASLVDDGERDDLDALPDLYDRPTAVYRLYDATGQLLYLGITWNLEARWTSHRQKKHWWPQVVRREVVWCVDRRAALAAEWTAITGEKPLHNIIGIENGYGRRGLNAAADRLLDDLVGVRVVMDTSAVLAFVNRVPAVGDMISAVVDEWGRIALPSMCLVEAFRLAPDGQQADVDLLTRHPCAVVTSTPVNDWEVLAEWTRVLGRVDSAAAVATAVSAAAYVLTGEPSAYGDDVNDLPVIWF
jgi:predicted GIY-YIG superfamily endonuclease